MTERPTRTQFSESEHRAIERFLTARTIPLTYATPERGPFVHGTGLFFRSRGELFLVTAAHVLQGIDAGLLGVPDRPVGNVGVWNLGDIAVHHPKEFEKFDVGVIELLNANFVERVAKQWQCIEEADVDGHADQRGEFVIAGYPTETVQHIHDALVPAPMLQLFTKPYEGPTDEAVPDYELLVRYGQTATGIFGGVRITPRLEGVSGAAVYSVSEPKGTIWSPEQALRLAGIQVSALHGSFARVTKWSLVSHLIALIREARRQ